MEDYDKYIAEEKWAAAEASLRLSVRKEPSSFYLNTCLSSVLYEQKRYEEAEMYSIEAYKQAPESPLVLWDYAGVLTMLSKYDLAIKLLQRIISYGEKDIGTKKTKEGIMWGRSMILDAYFKLGLIFYYKEDDLKAKTYFEKHIENRKKGLPSLFSKKEAIEWLEEIDHQLSD